MRNMKKAVSLLLSASLMLTTIVGGDGVQAAKKSAAKVSSVKITNAGKTLRLQKGKTFNLKTDVKVKPNKSKNKKVKFSSSNKKVVLVNSRGRLKGVQTGTAKITASSKVNPKKKATISVSVTKDVLVSSIKLNKTKITADEYNEEEIPLKVTKILPANAKNKKVVWSTDDENVADVDDDGVVTTGEVGTATITAKAADKGGAFATCRVVVTENKSQGNDDSEKTEEPPVQKQPGEVIPPADVPTQDPGQSEVSPSPEGPKETASPAPGDATEEPTEVPTPKPTEEPTEAPTLKPTEKPTVAPTKVPTPKPTQPPRPTKPAWTPDPNKKVENVTLTYDYEFPGHRMVRFDGTVVNHEDEENANVEGYPRDGIDVRYYSKVIVKYEGSRLTGGGDDDDDYVSWYGKATLSSTDDGLGQNEYSDGLFVKYFNEVDELEGKYQDGMYTVEYDIDQNHLNVAFDYEDIALIDSISVQLANEADYAGFKLKSIQFIANTEPAASTIPPEHSAQDYKYFNDYTLGWSNEVVAYKNGKKVSLADAGAEVYNKKSDNIFAQHFNNNKWNDEKITLTPPMQYTTEDGEAHAINSMLTNYDFIGDPSAIDNSDNDGKLYVYGTTEGIDYDKNDELRINGYNNHSLTILSSSDMVNWTDEGRLDNLNLTNEVSTASKTKCNWATKAWAPSGLKIDGDGDGKDEYYIFYANGGMVGYVKGDSPNGPWEDVHGKVLFNQSTPNCSGVVWCFDPAVLVDDKGDAYVYFGGGIPGSDSYGGSTDEQKAHPKTARVCKIAFEEGTGKVLLDGVPQELDAFYMFEDSEINQFHGKYYYSYCMNFNVPGTLQASDGVSNPIRSAEIGCYVSDDPMDITFDPQTQKSTDALKYLGSILSNPSSIYGNSYNNHHHMQTFKGHDYIFYHSQVLGDILFRDSKQYRNLHVDEIKVDEKTDKITINPSYEGASQIEDFDPYKNKDGSVKYINATTSANSAGVKSTQDDAMLLKSLSGSHMVLDEIDTGDWSCIKGVNFGDKGLKKFGVEYRSITNNGRIELFIDDPTYAVNKVASIDISVTNGKYAYKSVGITKQVTGKHDVYFVFRGSDYTVATWAFSENANAAAPDISDRPAVPTATPGWGGIDLDEYELDLQKEICTNDWYEKVDNPDGSVTLTRGMGDAVWQVGEFGFAVPRDVVGNQHKLTKIIIKYRDSDLTGTEIDETTDTCGYVFHLGDKTNVWWTEDENQGTDPDYPGYHSNTLLFNGTGETVITADENEKNFSTIRIYDGKIGGSITIESIRLVKEGLSGVETSKPVVSELPKTPTPPIPSTATPIPSAVAPTPPAATPVWDGIDLDEYELDLQKEICTNDWYEKVDNPDGSVTLTKGMGDAAWQVGEFGFVVPRDVVGNQHKLTKIIIKYRDSDLTGTEIDETTDTCGYVFHLGDKTNVWWTEDESQGTDPDYPGYHSNTLLFNGTGETVITADENEKNFSTIRIYDGKLGGKITIESIRLVKEGLSGGETPTPTETPIIWSGELSNPTIDDDGITTWDCVYFGNYWQNDTNGDGIADQDDEKQPIKWRVLSVDGDDVFLLADENLDCQPYNDEDTDVTWETCSLRSWLNDDFFTQAFTAEEQLAIRTTKVENDGNPEYGMEGGNDTSDQVYLPSLYEVANPMYGFSADYSSSANDRISKNTEYAKGRGAYTNATSEGVGNGYWWLRSPGDVGNTAVVVYAYGNAGWYGDYVNRSSVAVRPALHLDLSSASNWLYAGTITSNDIVLVPKPTQPPKPTPDPDKKVENVTLTYDYEFPGARMVRFDGTVVNHEDEENADVEGYPADGIDVRYYDKVIVKYESAKLAYDSDGFWSGKATLSSTDEGLGCSEFSDGLFMRWLNDVDDEGKYQDGVYTVEYDINEKNVTEGYDFEEAGLIDCISVQLANEDDYTGFKLKSIEFVAKDGEAEDTEIG